MVNSPFTYRSNCSPDFQMEVLSCEISTPDTSLIEIYLESDIFLQYTCKIGKKVTVFLIEIHRIVTSSLEKLNE